LYSIRLVNENDLNDLLELSKLALFINLPSDKEILKKKIDNATKSWKTPSKNLSKNNYIFALCDDEKSEVVGVSMIHAQHGTDLAPHYFLKVEREHRFSNTINTGFIHGTLKLGMETDGPTEIGGLILNPKFRKGPLRLGKQLSYVRFLFIARYPDLFKETIHAELMPPFDEHGNSPLWEAVGRKFFNMNYHDADILSRTNKEFIFDLFPSQVIYETLLPLEARNAIGKVGKDTLPVKKMLEGIGFSYTDEVDPFDGGPHYRARTENIQLINKYMNGKIELVKSLHKDKKRQIMISPKDSKDNEFVCHLTFAEIETENKKTIFKISAKEASALKLKDNQKASAIFFNKEDL
jgi:arginine N-succinyltransferase